MTLIADQKNDIHQESVTFRAAVSEDTGTRLGGSINFINHRQHSEKQFMINGPYGITTVPVDFTDGMVFFQFDSEIIDVWMFNAIGGSGGTTELDLRTILVAGGSATSIFTTTPTIGSTAASPSWVNCSNNTVASTVVNPTGTRNGVLNLAGRTTGLFVGAGTAMELHMTSVMTGGPQNCGILIHYRPV